MVLLMNINPAETVRTLNYGNYGISLKMGNAGFRSSAVCFFFVDFASETAVCTFGLHKEPDHVVLKLRVLQNQATISRSTGFRV